MGLQVIGTPLTWSQIKPHVDELKKRGVRGFLHLYELYKDKKNNVLKWGDEIEFNLVKFDHNNKNVYLLLKASELLPILQDAHKHDELAAKTSWTPEYANYMIEGIPARPYGDKMSDFFRLEGNMSLRRRQIQNLLGEGEYAFSLTAFPLNGCEKFTWPPYKPTPGAAAGYTGSIYIPDECVYNGHPRYPTVSHQLRQRKGSKFKIHVPIYFDINTPKPFVDPLPVSCDDDSAREQKENHIYMDATAFGMGCSCLQITFQAQNIDEARQLYDQLAQLTPIMLALSAAAPIWKGYLADIDSKWNVVSGSVDDRTPEELGEKPLRENQKRIYKSRYDSIDCYLSPEGAKYNDIDLVINEEAYKTLIENDIDELMAQHIAHLFIRDPVCVFNENLQDNMESDVYHFENIQSTNWLSMRFKPPPLNSNIGWRVEFRTMELQISDFENAAFVTFLVLLTRTILSFKLNLLIPISKIDENMQTAQRRDACRSEKFHFKKNIFKTTGNNSQIDYEKMSIDEIINGSDDFPGLIPLINDYMSVLNVDVDAVEKIREYLDFISARASGRLLTLASYIRKFVHSHPKYAHDSIVTQEITYDLLWRLQLISNGEIKCPEMYFQKLHKQRLE